MTARTYSLLRKITGGALITGALALWIYVFALGGADGNPKDAIGGIVMGTMLFVAGLPLYFWADDD